MWQESKWFVNWLKYMLQFVCDTFVIANNRIKTLPTNNWRASIENNSKLNQSDRNRQNPFKNNAWV